MTEKQNASVTPVVVAQREDRAVQPRPGAGRQQPAKPRPGGAPAAPTPDPQRARPAPIKVPPRTSSVRRFTFGKLLSRTFLGMVVLPTACVALFYVFIAASQFATESQFAVRGSASSSASLDVGGLLGTLAPSSTPEAADSFILVDFIHSRTVVEGLIERANFLEAYSRPEADFFYRLDPNQPIEDLVEYWKMMSEVKFSTDSGIIDLNVRAFRPADAQLLADTAIAMSEELVNELSERAREDSLRMARDEVARAESRYQMTRTAMADFRDTELEIDPEATATAKVAIVSALDEQLAARQAELLALSTTMSEDSPRVIYVKNQIEALKSQIENVRAQASTPSQREGGQPVLTQRLSRYEELVAEREFALRAYQSALASLETARIDADKQQRFLAVFVPPSIPELSDYPEGLRWTLIVGASLLLIWGLLALFATAVRDHIA